MVLDPTVAAFVLAALGDAHYWSVADHTVRRESWYSLAVFVAVSAVVVAAT